MVSKDKPISYSTFRDHLSKSLRSVVPDPSVYGTHSFRSGGASTAANSGVGDRVFQRHGRWKSVSAKDGYVKDDIASRIPVSKSLGFWLLGNCLLLQALFFGFYTCFFIIVRWCSAKTCKINLMVQCIGCLLCSVAEIWNFWRLSANE